MNFIRLLQTTSVVSKSLDKTKLKSVPSSSDASTNEPTVYFIYLQNEKHFIYLSKETDEQTLLSECETAYEFVSTNRPIEVFHRIRGGGPEDVDTYVKQFMQQFGIDSTRGGSYCDILLSEDIRSELQKELEYNL
jgi:hypothetical protein